MANSRRLVQLHTGRKIGLHAFARRRDGRLFLVLRSCSRRQRSPISACNKRNKESGCATLNGTSCDRAVLGTSNLCIANYPGDWGAALAAFDTAIEVRSAGISRVIPFDRFHLSCGDAPEVETMLEPGAVVTAILTANPPVAEREPLGRFVTSH